MKKILVSAEHKLKENPFEKHYPTVTLREYQFLPLLENGLYPILVPSKLLSNDVYIELLQDCEGLFLFGGSDADPKYYNEEVTADINRYDYRDEIEITLIRLAQSLQKPIFGICRGIQMINVALGGSLYQDIQQYRNVTEITNPPIHMQNIQRDGNKLSHDIKIESNSLLYTAVGKSNIRTNTYHHQIIKELGVGLESIATTSDGVIESIQNKQGTIWGIQWHPELSYSFDESSKQIFRYLANDYFT